MAFLRSLRVKGEALKNCCPAACWRGPVWSEILCFVQPLLLFQDLLLGGFEHGVEPAYDGHGEDDVPVLAPHVEVSEVVVGDVPDEVGDGGELAVLQFHIPFFGLKLILHERGIAGHVQDWPKGFSPFPAPR